MPGSGAGALVDDGFGVPSGFAAGSLGPAQVTIAITITDHEKVAGCLVMDGCSLIDS